MEKYLKTIHQFMPEYCTLYTFYVCTVHLYCTLYINGKYFHTVYTVLSCTIYINGKVPLHSVHCIIMQVHYIQSAFTQSTLCHHVLYIIYQWKVLPHSVHCTIQYIIYQYILYIHIYIYHKHYISMVGQVRRQLCIMHSICIF